MSNWFVALPVDSGVWFPRLSPPPTGTHLLAAADLHLTVAFLGNIGEPRARAAFRSLSPSAISCCEVLLGVVAPMGNTRRPSALSALVESLDPGSRAIAETLEVSRDGILEAAELPLETREMKPHVTLARLRRRAEAEDRRRAVAWAETINLGSPRIRLDRIGLYTGARDRKTRAYDIVETRSLGS